MFDKSKIPYASKIKLLKILEVKEHKRLINSLANKAKLKGLKAEMTGPLHFIGDPSELKTFKSFIKELGYKKIKEKYSASGMTTWKLKNGEAILLVEEYEYYSVHCLTSKNYTHIDEDFKKLCYDLIAYFRSNNFEPNPTECIGDPHNYFIFELNDTPKLRQQLENYGFIQIADRLYSFNRMFATVLSKGTIIHPTPEYMTVSDL